MYLRRVKTDLKIPVMDVNSIIDLYYKQDDELKNIYMIHARAVADFSLDADIGDLTASVKGFTGTIAVQGVTVGVGIGGGDDYRKINFVVKHNYSSSVFFVFG